MQTGPKGAKETFAMARKKSKQQGVGQKDALSGQQQTLSKSPVSPGDAAGAGGGGDAGVDRLARANQVG